MYRYIRTFTDMEQGKSASLAGDALERRQEGRDVGRGLLDLQQVGRYQSEDGLCSRDLLLVLQVVRPPHLQGTIIAFSLKTNLALLNEQSRRPD